MVVAVHCNPVVVPGDQILVVVDIEHSVDNILDLVLVDYCMVHQEVKSIDQDRMCLILVVVLQLHFVAHRQMVCCRDNIPLKKMLKNL